MEIKREGVCLDLGRCDGLHLNLHRGAMLADWRHTLRLRWGYTVVVRVPIDGEWHAAQPFDLCARRDSGEAGRVRPSNHSLPGSQIS